jgi:hypothetical protein
MDQQKAPTGGFPGRCRFLNNIGLDYIFSLLKENRGGAGLIPGTQQSVGQLFWNGANSIFGAG